MGTMLCCLPLPVNKVDQDLEPCKCYPKQDVSRPDLGSGVVVTPVAIVLRKDETLSALCARTKKKEVPQVRDPPKKSVRRNDSLRRSIRRSRSAASDSPMARLDIAVKQRSQSFHGIDKVGENQQDVSSSKKLKIVEPKKRPKSSEGYARGDIINYSSGYAVKIA